MRRLMRKLTVLCAVAACSILLATSGLHAAADFATPPSIDKYMTPENIADLKDGDVVKENIMSKTPDGKDKGTGVGLVWIKATPEAVMSQLDTFPTYKEWMPNVEETKVVKREGKRVDVFFKLSILGNEVHYTTIHEIDKENNVIRFRCDDSAPKKNVEDFTGAWVLKPFEGGTILAYTLDLNTGMAVPGFIQKWLSNAGLKKTVKAVKEQVEGK